MGRAGWREKVDDQDMNPAAEAVDRLLDEIPKGRAAVLVSRRDDLDNGDDPAQMVRDDDPIGAAGIDRPVGPAHDPRDGGRQRGDAAGRFFSGPPLGADLDRQDIRFLRPGPLFDEGCDPPGQAAGVERVLDPDGPALMEIVKEPGRYSRPIVNRHGSVSVMSIIPGLAPELPGVPLRFPG